MDQKTPIADNAKTSLTMPEAETLRDTLETINDVLDEEGGMWSPMTFKAIDDMVKDVLGLARRGENDDGNHARFT